MQRLASSLLPGIQAGPAAVPQPSACAAQRHTHTSERGWPYAPTPDDHVQSVSRSTSSISSSSPGAQQPAPKRVPALQRTVSELLEQLRHMKGARDIWEMAVKRNSMTTSLALLGGVLFADLLLYRPGTKRQAMVQSSLAAAAHSSSNSSSDGSTAGGSSTAQQQQQQPPTSSPNSSSSSSSLSNTHREDLGSQLRRQAAGVMATHG